MTKNPPDAPEPKFAKGDRVYVVIPDSTVRVADVQNVLNETLCTQSQRTHSLFRYVIQYDGDVKLFVKDEEQLFEIKGRQ